MAHRSESRDSKQWVSLCETPNASLKYIPSVSCTHDYVGNPRLTLSLDLLFSAFASDFSAPAAAASSKISTSEASLLAALSAMRFLFFPPCAAVSRLEASCAAHFLRTASSAGFSRLWKEA